MKLVGFEDAEPVALDWVQSGDVRIGWNDGTGFTYPRAFLREYCPCATCQGTHGSTTTLVKATAAPPAAPTPKPGRKATFAISSGPKPPPVNVATQITEAEPMGAYAVKFHYGDGHSSGIYSWRYLRFLGEVLEGRAPRE